MSSSAKREAPATALPDLISEIESINELLESNEEGYVQEPSRSQMKARRAALAEQIADLENKRHPSESDAARRSRGLTRIWLPRDVVAALDSLCEVSGVSRADHIRAWIESERKELATIRGR